MTPVETPQAPTPAAGEEPVFGGRRDPAYATAAAILAFLAGCFGFMALIYDYPADIGEHAVGLAGLHAVLAVFVGGLARGRWYVSIIVAWGAMVMGLPWHLFVGPATPETGWGPWGYSIFAYAVVVPATIAGGWFGNWLVARIAR